MNRLKVLLALVALAMGIAPLIHAQVGKSQGLLDANRATQEELMSVPHMNAAYVKAIMDKRPFANVTEFAAALMPALTKAQLNEVYGKVFVHVNLNTATDDELLSIPAAQPNRPNGTFIDLSAWDSLAANPDDLIDKLDELLMHFTMSDSMWQTIRDAVSTIPAANRRQRVRTAIYLIVTSSQYQVQR